MRSRRAPDLLPPLSRSEGRKPGPRDWRRLKRHLSGSQRSRADERPEHCHLTVSFLQTNPAILRYLYFFINYDGLDFLAMLVTLVEWTKMPASLADLADIHKRRSVHPTSWLPGGVVHLVTSHFANIPIVAEHPRLVTTNAPGFCTSPMVQRVGIS